ncbi:MAG: hypothetical protein COU63_04875 [Candidatus Pacebacteria bacterium CG10_big_fil_rev_8_21_14_0_10_36_11]|nr:hypothetical protein [Candidatus Pacearchaeota archaeon]OIP73964.1 MAG: hypothetical protein AUK08_01740 [Candidatus Pacebacteria bacterium CG2_30_36_39]PIR64397.1 MAG: hypothetical protein COU63_04875 [Candidatus Pacebacteria bacterium CG10_big_fil_rev_8_21_14_0_10_36_11]PJC42788.1 MAG: hypothetical protein CO040_02640 [Candidatus Pacebacteria bacterium CG_4_9_14_0_2_um_filter_36_8]
MVDKLPLPIRERAATLTSVKDLLMLGEEINQLHDSSDHAELFAMYMKAREAGNREREKELEIELSTLLKGITGDLDAVHARIIELVPDVETFVREANKIGDEKLHAKFTWMWPRIINLPVK